MSSLKNLKRKMLEVNPNLNIDNEEVIIANLVIGRRLSQRISEEELASKVNCKVDQIVAIEEGQIPLNDPLFRGVLQELDISEEDIKSTLTRNKIK